MNRVHVVACATLLLAACQPTDPSKPKKDGPVIVDRLPATADELRRELNAEGFDLKGLAREGKTILPLCQKVLEDASSKPLHVARCLTIVENADGNRSQFVELALGKLGDRSDSVRYSALMCLAAIGTERDTAPVAVLLFDEYTEVRYAAAKTLAAIGGPRDVLVLDIVIRNADRYHDAKGNRLLPAEYDVKHFEKCKAELEARLKKQEKAEQKK